MYTVKLIDKNKNKQRDIFECDTIEEAHICAQYYMRHRTEFTSVIYIVPCFDNKNYDDDIATEYVHKCELKNSEWRCTSNLEKITDIKRKLAEIQIDLNNLC